MSYENNGLGTGQNQTAKLENLLMTISLQHGHRQVRQKGRDQIRFIGAQMLFMNNLDFSSKIDVFVWLSETLGEIFCQVLLFSMHF